MYNPMQTKITDEETKAGFVATILPNDNSHFLGEPETVEGVICPIGESDRLLKTVNPEGQETYVHQRFGRWAHSPQGEPKWLPAFAGEPCSPQKAVDLANSRLDTDAEIKIVNAVPEK